MKDFPVALQLYSVREDMEADFAGTLQKVKEIGYDGVEFAGLFGHDAREVNKMCKDAGLVPISAHVPFMSMISDPAILEVYRYIGCQYVIIPSLPGTFRPGQPRFAEMLELTKGLGEKALALGLKLGYHNHDFEFIKIDGKYAIDLMYEEVPSELLQTEFDTCWVNVAGEDPCAYLRKYAGRIDLVHLKDYSGTRSENMYALIGVDEDKKKQVSQSFQYRPLGMGIQNVPSILSSAKECGAKWMVVEQDQPSYGKTPLECAGLSLEYLNSLD